MRVKLARHGFRPDAPRGSQDGVRHAQPLFSVMPKDDVGGQHVSERTIEELSSEHPTAKCLSYHVISIARNEARPHSVAARALANGSPA